ncbi:MULTISPECIES: PqqD family protein [unclassified Nocardiopsis]|uniref:PqqD family protein n=1 Tax=Nocardiopsis TaxID=2013 RepID=UPI00387B75FA
MTRLRPAPGVHTAADRDGAVLLDTVNDRLYGLNPTAAALWAHLVGGGNTVLEDLAIRWGTEPERLRADALALAGTLIHLGLAVRTGREK